MPTNLGVHLFVPFSTIKYTFSGGGMADIDQTADFQRVFSTTDFNQLPSEFFKKSHNLVFSQLALSAVEHDIMALFLTRLAKEDWSGCDNPPRYLFGSDVLEEWFGIRKTYLFSSLLTPSDRLSKRRIGVVSEGKKGKGGFDFIPLFNRLRYKDGVLLIVPNGELREQYLCLSQGHSQVPHRQFRKLKSEYSKRLLTMLCRFKTSGTLHPQTISELHAFFGLLDEKGQLVVKTMATNSVFLRRVVQLAVKEIQVVLSDQITFSIGASSGQVGYETIKKGRSIDKVQFLYEWKAPISKLTEFEMAVNAVDVIAKNKGHKLTLIDLKNVKSQWFELSEMEGSFVSDPWFVEEFRRLIAAAEVK